MHFDSYRNERSVFYGWVWLCVVVNLQLDMHLHLHLCSLKVPNLPPERPIRETAIKLCFSNVLICFMTP